jgi:DNA-binding FrmR family transcriptional regulator
VNTANGARKAHKVDDEGKQKNLVRLRRIEGQVRGLQKMIEEERYCVDILAQINAVDQALRAVSRELVKNHLRHCAAHALKGSEDEQTEVIDELVDVLVRHK